MTSSPVSWQELIAVIGGILGHGGVVAGTVCRRWSKFNEQALKLASLELSIAERYVKSTTHAATEERLVSAVEAIRDDFREMGRRLYRFLEWLHDKPKDRPVERKGGMR
jgi:hypothetical protein